MRAGPWRPKWDTARTVKLPDDTVLHTTWLGRTIGRAIESRKRKDPVLLLDFDDEPASDTLSNETPEQIIARLERELAKERAVVAAQQTIIRAQRATIERQNRERYAQWRLRRSKLKAAQVDAIMTIADIASKRAEYHDTDSPIITAGQIGEGMGMHESSARSNAEAVCNLPGSPIQRVSEYRKDGKYGQLTTYKLDVRDPVEILERFVPIAEALDAPKAARPKRLRCPVHPDAGVRTICDADGCGVVFSHRPGEPSEPPSALCEEVTRIEAEPPTVDVPVLTHVRHARIEPDGLDELTLARRAREAVDIPMGRAPDKYKQPAPPEPEPANLGPIKVTRRDVDPALPWRHDRCGSLERYTDSEGRERCEGCTEVLASSEVAS
jgi:hypothetical protein